MEGIDHGGYENTGLGIASRNEHVDIVQYLLSLPQINVAALNKYGYNALHLAAWKNQKNLDVIKLLLSHKTCSNLVLHAKANIGANPLGLAQEYNNTNIKNDIVDLLVSKGGKSKEEIIALKKRLETIDAKYIEEFPNNHAISPFIIACQHGRLEDVQTFIESGLDVNIVGKSDDGSFYTGLSAASRYEQIEVVKFLLQLPDINVNIAADEDGYNSLHYADRTFFVLNLDYFDNNLVCCCTKDVLNTETSLGDTPLTFADGNGLNRFKYLDGNNISDVETEIVHLLKVKMGRMDTMTINNEG
eukprot:g117.t1